MTGELENAMQMRTAIRLVVACLLAASIPLSAQPQKKIYAQQLIDDAIARHPEALVLMMHVTPPGKSENVVIASNIGRIGKKGDEDDLEVIRSGKPKLEVNKTGDRFEVELPCLIHQLLRVSMVGEA